MFTIMYENPIPSVGDEAQEIQKEHKDTKKQGKIKKVEDKSDYKYQEIAYFAFIDVLGFKKAFDDHREAQNNNDKRKYKVSKAHDIAFAEKYREVFIYYFELMEASSIISQKERTGCYAGQTSDSLYFYCTRKDWLIDYIKIFLHLNLFAMSKDVFFRGGIARGNLFVKDPYQFYGESVIYSYLLESDISKYPTIVIDENTYNDIKDCKEVDLLVKEKRGRHYLNIFAPLYDEFSLPLKDDAIIDMKKIDKKKILNNIKKNQQKFEYNVGNYEKYVFLVEEYEEYEKKMNKARKNA